MTGVPGGGARRTAVIAHRTAPLDAPENSLEGVRVAAALGADLVEFDVRGTRDGVPVLMHDPFLFRTTNRWWPVRFISSRSLSRTVLKGTDQTLPRLSDVLAALPAGVGVAIEIKQASIARATLHEVRRHDVAERTLLWAEKERIIRTLVRAAPDIEVALLRAAHDPAARRRLLDDAVRWGARAVSIAHTEVEPGHVADARARGLNVYSCLRDLPSQIPDQVRLLDGLITDHVADAVALLAQDSTP